MLYFIYNQLSTPDFQFCLFFSFSHWLYHLFSCPMSISASFAKHFLYTGYLIWFILFFTKFNFLSDPLHTIIVKWKSASRVQLLWPSDYTDHVNFLGQNTGTGSHYLLPGNLPRSYMNPDLSYGSYINRQMYWFFKLVAN